MAYINIDVDLDEFDTDELVQEVINRLKNGYRKKLKPNQRQELKESAQRLLSELSGLGDANEINVSSLNDRMKYEFIASNFQKIDLGKLETVVS